MASRLESGCQVLSDLLSVREKGVLFAVLGSRCKLLASAVVQVLVAKETQSGGLGWSCLGCGVVCLIGDYSVHSHFLRLYNVKQAKLLWEQELYIPFKYTATCTYFHTFPSDGHQAGLNFADETEAEGFHVAVQSIQRKQERMSVWIKKTCADKEDNSTLNRPDEDRSETNNTPEIKPLEHLDQKKHFSTHTPPVTVTPTSNLFRELDPSVRKLLELAGLSEGDLKDRDSAELIHGIITNLGGLEAVRKEMKTRGSHTISRVTRPITSLSLKKGPLPPVPSATSSITSQQASMGNNKLCALPPWIPPPPSTTAPPPPDRIKKSASFKPVGSPSVAETGPILTALRDALRQNQNILHRTGANGCEVEHG